jgi:large subunit ribosomal protein L10
LKAEEKRQVVADLHEKMQKAKVAVLTRSVGLNVEKMTQLRRELRKSAVEYRIVKNTLLRLAIKGTDKEPLQSETRGPIGVAWSEKDIVAPARVLSKFTKDFPQLKILVAAFDGKLYGAADIQTWVNLPSLEGLRAKIVGLIQAPSTQLARLVQTPGTRMAQVLAARSKEA